MDDVERRFRAELDLHGIPYVRDDDGYEVRVQGQVVTVCLDNLRREFDRDRDVAPIVAFVERLRTVGFDVPPWAAARGRVRYTLQPADDGAVLPSVPTDRVTSELSRVYVVVSEDGSRITWIDDACLRGWGVAAEEVRKHAERNMAELVAAARLEVTEVAGEALGMLWTEEVSFKAAMVVSPGFRRLVEPTHGWPVLVVLPARDFVYVLRDDARDILSRLGTVVVREWRQSPYPLTREVLRVSDDGVNAIGVFPDSD